jgi:hypothetical protein
VSRAAIFLVLLLAAVTALQIDGALRAEHAATDGCGLCHNGP